jgi:hypothetical protein
MMLFNHSLEEGQIAQGNSQQSQTLAAKAKVQEKSQRKSHSIAASIM